MKRVRIIGLVVIAVCALGVAIASTASAAVEFLRAEWLIGGEKMTAALAVEQSGELNIVNTNGGGVGIRVEILCIGILDGTVGPGDADEISELLNAAKESINLAPLTELALTCANTKNCTEPLVWAEELPWKTEVELMEDGGSTFFVDLWINSKFYMECLVLGVSVNELCQAPTIAADLSNEAGGVVDLGFSDAFQELAELKLGECGGRAETYILEGVLRTTPDAGSLTVSSEG